MPGKAAYLLALSVLLLVADLKVSCQAAKSYSADSNFSVYKPKHYGRHRRSVSHHRGAKVASGNMSPMAAISPDPSLIYRGLTHDTILTALKANPYVSLDQGADVKFDGATLQLALWSDRRASERDQKIDAVLLARTVERQFPGVFEEYHCSFFDPRSPGHSRLVSVKTPLLSEFGQGKISREELLQTVPMVDERGTSLSERYAGLSYRQILQESPVLEGTYAAERKELSDQLTTLKANGYDVNQATRQFFALEDLVRTRQYAQLSQAFAKTRQCIAAAVAKAPNISVASSRTKNWQR